MGIIAGHPSGLTEILSLFLRGPETTFGRVKGEQKASEKYSDRNLSSVWGDRGGAEEGKGTRRLQYYSNNKHFRAIVAGQYSSKCSVNSHNHLSDRNLKTFIAHTTELRHREVW